MAGAVGEFLQEAHFTSDYLKGLERRSASSKASRMALEAYAVRLLYVGAMGD